MKPDAREASPLPRYLFIVARNNPAMFDYLRHHFADAPEVDVLLDRRMGERRQNTSPVREDRRRGERRARPEVDERLKVDSYAFLRVR